MNFSEKCRRCSVIVDGGSGVLFQPMTEEYSYVLTATHNLYNDTNQDSYTQPKNIEDIKITFHDGREKNIVKKYEHDNLDIAILKIDKVEIESPLKQFNEVKNGDTYKFYGYPENRRGESKVEGRIQFFDLVVGEVTSFKIVSRNIEHFEQQSIIGCSGGGVFKEDGNNFYLVGIECRMDAQSTGEENNTRLRFIFIEAFNEIIEQNQSELEPLYPPYMNDFNLLISNIFLLNDYESRRDFVRDRLQYLSKTYIATISPIVIKSEFENDLLINGFDINNVTNSELWQMYLEFALLSIVIDSQEKLTVDKIKNIYKKRKILFAKADRWVELKEDILKSNLLGLQKHSTVFVACDGDRRPNKVDISYSIIDVTRPPQPEEMRIDQGINYIVDIKYKHIYAIEKLLLDNEEKFVTATGIDIDKILNEVLQNVC